MLVQDRDFTTKIYLSILLYYFKAKFPGEGKKSGAPSAPPSLAALNIMQYWPSGLRLTSRLRARSQEKVGSYTMPSIKLNNLARADFPSKFASVLIVLHWTVKSMERVWQKYFSSSASARFFELDFIRTMLLPC